ncbi:MAG: glycine cleavage system aminomethyltransferase GcvT, partial [Candidatus Heimdallarchaeota archaeon]|nr:glycine cleavage system aminomethyltransferase GcvT [Candidatus Heimdallarchaeota archaeon]
GMAGYTMILNEMGGIKDDVIVYQLKSDEFLLVCNAGNRQKIWNWIDSFAKLWKLAGKDFNIEDKSDTSCMIAVQGPRVENIMKDLTSDVLPDKRFRIAWISIGDTPVLCSTTGYTGEAGYELMVFADIDTINEKAIALWNQLLVKKVVPCALGSRDTLRLESGYCLYGNDMDETTHLLETGLDFFPFVKIDKTSGFVGQDAVLSFKDKVDKIRVGFKLLAKGIARHGYKVFVDDKEVGWVASGTQSPITKEPIGMAYVPITHKEKGSLFQIEIRNKKVDAEVIDFPTFDTTKYGLRRQL